MLHKKLYQQFDVTEGVLLYDNFFTLLYITNSSAQIKLHTADLQLPGSTHTF